jgi:hypothetical protein
LIYNTNDNLTNVMISPDWHIWIIDFIRAFRTQIWNSASGRLDIFPSPNFGCFEGKATFSTPTALPSRNPD